MRLSFFQFLSLLCCALVSGCATGGVSKSPAAVPSPRWILAPDVGALADLWLGGDTACAPETATETPQSTPNARHRRCSVAGWTSVLVTWTPNEPRSRKLMAHNDHPQNCIPERFAPKVEILGTTEGQILTEVFSLLRGGPLDGEGLAVTSHWDRPGACDLTIARPSNPPLQPGSPQ